MKGPFNNGGEIVTKKDFDEAVIRNNQRLYLIALSFTHNKYDAEDILQNTFLKLWKNSKPFVDNIHIDKWLTVVCINESKNNIKNLFRVHNELNIEVLDKTTFDNENQYDIFNAIMSLPKNERTVIHLFYYEDLKTKEIAKMLKISESAVKTRLNRARNKIKLILGDEWINE